MAGSDAASMRTRARAENQPSTTPGRQSAQAVGIAQGALAAAIAHLKQHK